MHFMSSKSRIVVRGARQHNLKNINLALPRESLIVFSGLSGSGKTSLAFDTIYQEGQRRFMESLSAYARQFLGQMDKPDVDHIEGLSPAISIDQKTTNRNPRSTVGTITEIYDHLRLFFARLGTPHCPQCGREVASQTAEQIARALYVEAETTLHDSGTSRRKPVRGMILAPVVQDRKGEYRKELAELLENGYLRARIDGEVRRLDAPIVLDRYVRHTIEVVVDRVVFDQASRGRITEAVEKAIEMAEGVVSALVGDRHLTFGTSRACPTCGVSIPEMEPRLFSFNSPHGACPECDGLGERVGFAPERIVPDDRLSILEGAVRCLTREGRIPFSRFDLGDLVRIVRALGDRAEAPWRDLEPRTRQVLLHGATVLERGQAPPVGVSRFSDSTLLQGFPGILPALELGYHYTHATFLEAYRTHARCPACGGRRLNPIALAVTFRGENIWDVVSRPVDRALAWFEHLELSPTELAVGREIVRELRARLRFLVEVGLGYLTLDRSAATLAGGEAQRIRLARQVGSGLQGVLYVLDEPSIGLHPRDNTRLLDLLCRLRDGGNTVLVVEHDRETMERADYLVDIGPGAGSLGGRITDRGTPSRVARGRSLTGRYLRGEEVTPVPRTRRTGTGARLLVRGASHHNLKGIDVSFPLGTFIAVTGVSGSGKSTLVRDILYRTLARRLHQAKTRPGAHREIVGIEHLDKVIEIDQSPIGRTPRSNPATYTKVFDEIRRLYAQLPEARLRGYAPGRFSFNVPGGRCEACQGAGVKTIEMQFLADVEVPCEVCGGKRFNLETLAVTYKGRNIHHVLSMTVTEAARFFANQPRIRRTLQVMETVGLGYVPLGQPSTTLSGGEAQRIKLAAELRRPPTGRTLYILDEPTTGLHALDIRELLGALQRLVDAGNTVVVIEHNLDVIKVADHIIDLGPEGGDAGGNLVAAGTPEQVAACDQSHTGRFLRDLLATHSPGSSVSSTVSNPAPVREPLPDSRGSRPIARPPVRTSRGRRDLFVAGASKHNLKHIDVRIPRNKITVITGVSGSGKTSLAFDTLFVEGQRRYVESLSTYARRFLGRMESPSVDSISGISPAISVDQKAASRNPRSTVATSTEIHDYLRLLFARVGTPHCPSCGVRLEALTPGEAAATLLAEFPGERGEVLASLGGQHHHPGEGRRTGAGSQGRIVRKVDLLQQGFVRIRLDGRPVRLEDGAVPETVAAERVELVVDRVMVRKSSRSRLVEAVEAAYAHGNGAAWFESAGGVRRGLSTLPACVRCGFVLRRELSPQSFSFNSHVGACQRCDGLGVADRVSQDRLMVHPDRPLLEGALHPEVVALLRPYLQATRLDLERRLRDLETGVGTTWNALNEQARTLVLHGAPTPRDLTVLLRNPRSARARRADWPGLVPLLEALHRNRHSLPVKHQEVLRSIIQPAPCPECGGARLKPVPLAVRVAGRNIAEVTRQTVDGALTFFRSMELPPREARIAKQVLAEIISRLLFLQEVGVGYLTLDRASSTLSGGEAQRIRLASQLGSHLAGVLYVLDEPTIGLHPRDTNRLLATLKGLRDRGNTVVVVEHDARTIHASDHVIDLGPGAGERGGQVVARGTPRQIARNPRSLTGAYLSGRRSIPIPTHRRRGEKGVVIQGAGANNLKGFDVHFPLGVLMCVTGVSGSGKSTLVMDVLARALARRLARAHEEPGAHTALHVSRSVQHVAVIDQSPLGRSPRSNSATYTGVLDPIRDLFASLPESRVRGYTKGRFSFNLPGGRCEACEGRGAVRVEMHFLSDVWVPCEECKGRRYNAATLEVRFKGRSIADVLDMEVSEAVEFFQNQPRIRRLLEPLEQTGLGYMRVGQAANTLSGGEAQRVKLASALVERKGRGFYILDEPTTGLHFQDVEHLLDLFQRLVDRGNTVVVIEHNPEVMKVADRILDLGPEGGAGGGRVVAEGTPEEVAATPGSHTGEALRWILGMKDPLLAEVGHRLEAQASNRKGQRAG